MNELIKVNNGIAILDEKTAQKIAEFEARAKEIKEAEEELKKMIIAEMEDKGVVKVDTEALTITYVQATERETFDSKTFREEYPDLYDGYIKFTPVKASIRIKVK